MYIKRFLRESCTLNTHAPFSSSIKTQFSLPVNDLDGVLFLIPEAGYSVQELSIASQASFHQYQSRSLDPDPCIQELLHG